MKRSMGAVLVMSALAVSCSVGPDYKRVEVEVPSAYKEGGDWKVAQPQDAVARGKWWEAFGDNVLNALEEEIVVSNQTLKIAEARYRQSVALVQSARAGFFPSVGANASAQRSRTGSGRAGFDNGANNNYNLSLGVNWELDVWGRVRRLVEANQAGATASAADVEAAKLSLQAELAQSYFQLRVLDVQKELLDDTVDAYEKSLVLTRNRYEVGVAGRSDVVQAETQLRSAQAQALDLGVQRAQLEHAIAVLIGKVPANFSLERAKLVAVLPPIPVALPTTLLERRPDIAAAERRVAAANAQIGVAKAAYFPALSFSASGGFAGSTINNLISAPNRFWSFGPALALSVFDAGKRGAATDQAIAGYDENVASYRQTVLEGFQEVEDNLAALRILDQERKIQEDAVRAARESVTLTLNQYKAGTVSYLNVVIVQATQLSNERTAVGIRGRELAASVGLIKALGGSWDVAKLPGARL